MDNPSLEQLLATIYASYDRALADKRTAIPSPLMLSIEYARAKTGPLTLGGATQKYVYQQDARGGGDMTVAGGILRPGS